MSFDIYLMHFEHGEVVSAKTSAIEKALAPYIYKREPEHNFALLKFSDGGTADLYGTHSLDKSFMVNRVSENEAFTLLFKVAQENKLAIVAPGYPIIVTSNDDLAQLPDDTSLDKIVVQSAEEFTKILTNS